MEYTEEEQHIIRVAEQATLAADRVKRCARDRVEQRKFDLEQERNQRQIQDRLKFQASKAEYGRTWTELDNKIRTIKSQKYQEILELVREDTNVKFALEESWEDTVKQFQSTCDHEYRKVDALKARSKFQKCIHCDYNPSNGSPNHPVRYGDSWGTRRITAENMVASTTAMNPTTTCAIGYFRYPTVEDPMIFSKRQGIESTAGKPM